MTATKRAFILATGADTGGAAIRVVEAFATDAGQQSGWSVRSMVAADNYIHYPADLPYSRLSLEATYDAADVVVLNNTLAGHFWYDAGQGKPTVLMHHGLHEGHFSQSIEQVVAEATDIGARQIGSTVNLELYGPITWAPIPYPVDELLKLRQGSYEPSTSVRIAHAPTDRSVKSTETVVKAVETLQKRGYPVELLLIERQTHAKTIEIKAKHADILVDQLKLGYGCNAIEAWAMGIPVIGGVTQYAEWRDHMLARFAPDGLPFYEANEENLTERIAQLVRSVALREHWAAVGLDHVRRFHDDAAVVPILSDIYASAGPTKAEPHGGLQNRRTDRALRGMSHDERLALLREASAAREANREVRY